MSYDPKNFIYQNGLRTTSAYQVSGIPYATGSLSLEASSGNAFKVAFPYVTRWLTVVNRSNQNVRVGFSKAGVEGTNYFTVHKGNTTPTDMSRLELKVNEIHLISHGSAITSQVDIVAGLTTIPTGSLVTNWSGSIGVG
tara:strand:- start:682 stop:1098 length:417 start_codon:yes stop_codon:yes gene_type:complete